MGSGRLIFDSFSSHGGNMLILGGSGSPLFLGMRSVLSLEEGANKRRPFFTTAEELLEDEYYEEQLPEKKRRLTPEQVISLMEKPVVAGKELDSGIENATIEGQLSPPSIEMLATIQPRGDRPSTGSRGSTVVDRDGAAALQVTDSSGDSYFQESLNY